MTRPGKDKFCAESVWLHPPQDVYTEIANVVRKKVAADSAKERNPWAPLLHDFIDRKLVIPPLKPDVCFL